jgi:hypothetical protein
MNACASICAYDTHRFNHAHIHTHLNNLQRTQLCSLKPTCAGFETVPVCMQRAVHVCMQRAVPASEVPSIAATTSPGTTVPVLAAKEPALTCFTARPVPCNVCVSCALHHRV